MILHEHGSVPGLEEGEKKEDDQDAGRLGNHLRNEEIRTQHSTVLDDLNHRVSVQRLQLEYGIISNRELLSDSLSVGEPGRGHDPVVCFRILSHLQQTPQQRKPPMSIVDNEEAWMLAMNLDEQ